MTVLLYHSRKQQNAERKISSAAHDFLYLIPLYISLFFSFWLYFILFYYFFFFCFSSFLITLIFFASIIRLHMILFTVFVDPWCFLVFLISIHFFCRTIFTFDFVWKKKEWFLSIYRPCIFIVGLFQNENFQLSSLILYFILSIFII